MRTPRTIAAVVGVDPRCWTSTSPAATAVSAAAAEFTSTHLIGPPRRFSKVPSALPSSQGAGVLKYPNRTADTVSCAFVLLAAPAPATTVHATLNRRRTFRRSPSMAPPSRLVSLRYRADAASPHDSERMRIFDRGAHHVPTILRTVIVDGAMHARSVVPEDQVPDLPAMPIHEGRFGRMLEQEIQHRPALLGRQLEDPGCGARTHVKRLSLALRMDANHRVVHWGPLRQLLRRRGAGVPLRRDVGHLLVPEIVLGVKPVQEALHRLGQRLVRPVHVGEHRVAAYRRNLDRVQD